MNSTEYPARRPLRAAADRGVEVTARAILARSSEIVLPHGRTDQTILPANDGPNGLERQTGFMGDLPDSLADPA
jgi:hypothetical protein